MRLVLLGPPGSGKGTQARILADRMSLHHISTGEILRQASINGTKWGLKAKDYWSQGKLVPDEIIIPITHEVLRGEFYRDGFF